MTYDGSIRVDSRIDGAGFDKGINSMVASVGKLGVAMAAVFTIGAIANFVNQSVQEASKLQAAFVGLKSIVEGNGKSYQEANAFLQEYTKDGLIPASEAATAYKNLISRGYAQTDVEKTLIALKDSAAFGRQAALSMGQAVEGATEGLKNENSLLVDNAGVTRNVSQMWADYAKQIGVGVQSLTKQQKIQAEVNGIMNETRFQVGDAAKYTATYAGQQAILSANFLKLKQAIGNAFIPVLRAIMPTINAVVQGLTQLFNIFAAVTELIFGKQIEIGSTAKDAAKGQDQLAGSTAKAGKAAKGALANFDDLNVLQKEMASGGGGGGATVTPIKTEPKDTKPLIDLSKVDFGPFTGQIEDLKTNFKLLADSVKLFWETSGIQPFLQYVAAKTAESGLNLLNGSLLILSGFLDMCTGSAKFLVALFKGDFQAEIAAANITTGGLIKVIEGLSVALLGKNVTDNIKAFFSDVKNGYMLGWDLIVQWWRTSAIKKWWDNDIAPWFTAAKWSALWASVKSAFTSGWSGITSWWNKSGPSVWWTNNVAPWFTLKKWSDLLDNVKDAFSNVFGAIGKNIGIAIKTAINGVIESLNWLIDKWNSIKFVIPSIVPGIGGKTVGVPQVGQIAPIPLANGGVIQPNSPFLAMMGDQKSGVNIETPLATMIDAFKTTLSEMGGTGAGSVALYLDGTKLGEAMLPKLNQAQQRKGVNLVVRTV